VERADRRRTSRDSGERETVGMEADPDAELMLRL